MIGFINGEEFFESVLEHGVIERFSNDSSASSVHARFHFVKADLVETAHPHVNGMPNIHSSGSDGVEGLKRGLVERSIIALNVGVTSDRIAKLQANKLTWINSTISREAQCGPACLGKRLRGYRQRWIALCKWSASDFDSLAQATDRK